MKKPRIADFDPAAAERELGSPLDGMPLIERPRGAQPKPQHLKESQPAQAQSAGKLAPEIDVVEKPEKYTTHVEASLVKKIKLYAVENDMNDYDVVRVAVREYLDKHK